MRCVVWGDRRHVVIRRQPLANMRLQATVGVGAAANGNCGFRPPRLNRERYAGNTKMFTEEERSS